LTDVIDEIGPERSDGVLAFSVVDDFYHRLHFGSGIPWLLLFVAGVSDERLE
jgi:hypothetical protein